MTKLYICNMALKAFCFQCNHSYPHEQMSNPYHYDEKDVCTKWGTCCDSNGYVMSKVRCVEYKGE